MLDQNRKITDENDLRVALCTPSIDPLNNEYFAIVANYDIEYKFHFPLHGRQFSDYESSQVFNQSFNIKYTLKFENCTFENDIILYFHLALDNRDIIFHNCTFNKSISITSYENNIIFHDCTFNGVVNTKNARWRGFAIRDSNPILKLTTINIITATLSSPFLLFVVPERLIKSAEMQLGHFFIVSSSSLPSNSKINLDLDLSSLIS